MRFVLTSLIILVALSACGSTAAQAGTPTAGLTPYVTETHSPTGSPIPPVSQAILPTPTPFIYTIVSGDTLSGIAQEFGVTLEALIAANPGVQPTALTVGTKLTIPVGGDTSGEATPTPVPVGLPQARCWPEASGGLWCFALLRNDFPEAIENISVQFTLLDPGGKQLASQVAFAALDILPGWQSMPVAAHFPPPIGPQAAVRAEVLTSIRLLPNDPRYLPASVLDTLVRLDGSGRIAQVGGTVRLSGSNGTANTIWVLGVAYDAAGEAVGIRRWESPAPLKAGDRLPFSFTLSSLGPAIEHVDFLAEARP